MCKRGQIYIASAWHLYGYIHDSNKVYAYLCSCFSQTDFTVLFYIKPLSFIVTTVALLVSEQQLALIFRTLGPLASVRSHKWVGFRVLQAERRDLERLMEDALNNEESARNQSEVSEKGFLWRMLIGFLSYSECYWKHTIPTRTIIFRRKYDLIHHHPLLKLLKLLKLYAISGQYLNLWALDKLQYVDFP